MKPTNLPSSIIEGSVDLWIANLNSWKPYTGKLRTLISVEEISRLDRLKINNKREEFTCSRGILRIILSRYLTEDPNEIQINYTRAGKPTLPNSEIQFNISHSGDFLICGISKNNLIGLDIQEIYSISSLDRIINNFFNPTEIQYLRSLSSREVYQEHFFGIWTAKEAYLKAVGDGIQGSYNQVSIIPESEDLKTYRLALSDTEKNVSNWTIKSLKIAQGYCAALAYEGTPGEVRRFEFIPEDFFMT